jgi:lipopolysaccharide export system protein LptA
MKGMPITTARLRTWIALAAGLLIAAIAGFFVYGRLQGRRFSSDLPDGLSSGIQQSTNGFTYSESRGGHTIYTLHAAKAVQFKNSGHAELHDVSITLYGAQGTAANRIYGSAFDWDPVNGIARATGEVQIDFQGSTGPSTQESTGKDTVHVKTSGLIFNKKTGVASTSEKIEFHLAEAAGSATGASFDSQSGVMVLTADVAFNSSINGNPLAVRARHAQYDRSSRQLFLVEDQSDYADSHSSADQTIVGFRTDGSAFQAEAEGNVVFTGRDGQRIHTRKAHVDLGPKSEPQRAILDGGLLYVSDTPTRLLHGSASSGTILFASGQQTTIKHAQLRDAVSVVEEEKVPPVPSKAALAKGNPPQTTTRQMGGSKVDIDFVPGQDGRPEARNILADGAARLNVHTIYAKTPPEDSTVQGDQLFATLTPGETLSTLRGTGHTNLDVVTPDGKKQTSTGENLLLTFTAEQPRTTAQLQTAVQSGNVTLRQEVPPADSSTHDKPAPGPAITTATAQRADYNATTQRVVLSGDPRIQDGSGDLSAAVVELDRQSGNANATGGVKATYRQENGPQQTTPFAGSAPVHVVADHAHLDHATDITTFYGKAGTPARLWQGSDAISAPLIELSRAHGTLSAHGTGDGPAVNAVFTNAPRKTTSAVSQQNSVVRVQSRNLVYSENEHKAVFSGVVVAQTATGLVRSNFLDAYFSQSSAKPATQPGQPASQISKIVARGAVQLEQPGRKGTGEELTYTADNQQFVLTGTAAAPPRLNDQVRGTVTGNALIFNDRDDSVIVKGGDSQAVTQTRVAK